MSGSVFGKNFTVSTWGESHGEGLGAVIDGCPAGLPLSEEDIQVFLDRRRPGQSKFTTPRKESDKVHILSGVFEGRTTGTPVSLAIWNENQRSKDYSGIANVYRPGHADYCFDIKYGFRDYRGGGRSSGRETAARVAAGAVAVKLLSAFGIKFTAYATEIGGIAISSFDENEINNNAFYMPDADAAEKVAALAEQAIKEQDSLGGIVECRINGVPAGLGDPVFDKLDAKLAQAVFSIGAVKGFEIGEGFNAARLMGSENNDSFVNKDGAIGKATNHSGGILGGISDGSEIVFRTAFKPTPSIARAQNTVNSDGENVEISIHGRHDPMIVPRAVVVVESMAALTLADLLLSGTGSRLENIKKLYM